MWLISLYTEFSSWINKQYNSTRQDQQGLWKTMILSLSLISWIISVLNFTVEELYSSNMSLRNIWYKELQIVCQDWLTHSMSDIRYEQNIKCNERWQLLMWQWKVSPGERRDLAILNSHIILSYCGNKVHTGNLSMVTSSLLILPTRKSNNLPWKVNTSKANTQILVLL
jgi:hypothetical protein